MPELTACPTLPELLRTLRSDAAADEIETLARHFASCPVCVATIRSLNIGDSVIQRLRAIQPNGGEAARARLDNLILSLLESTRSGPTPSDNEETAHGSGLITDSGGDIWSSLLSPPLGLHELGRLGGYRVLRVLGSG